MQGITAGGSSARKVRLEKWFILAANISRVLWKRDDAKEAIGAVGHDEGRGGGGGGREFGVERPVC